MATSAAGDSKRDEALLLLASPPSPPTRAALSAAYHEPLSRVVSSLPAASSLTVAVAAPFLPIDWPSLQSLLAGLYSLVVSIQAESAPKADIDATVILVDHAAGRTYPAGSTTGADNDTIILDLGSFASRPSRWTRVFHPDTETGRDVLSAYVKASELSQVLTQEQLVALPQPSDPSKAQSTVAPGPASQRYRTVVLAGTFDHLHVGHKLLLHASVLLLSLPGPDPARPATVIIGVSGGALLKNKKFASELETWAARARSVVDVLGAILGSPAEVRGDEWDVPEGGEVRAAYRGGRILVRCVNIGDVYGPTVTEEDIDAIIVSAETRGGGRAVNDRRTQQGWRALDVYEVDVLSATPTTTATGREGAADDFSSKISSTEIRRMRAEARAREATTGQGG